MSRLTWLDRSIGWIAPAWGAKRAQARALTEALLGYEAARVGRRTDGWQTWGGSADAEVGPDHRRMRDRARDLVRNNPHAAKAVQVVVANKIGTGIMAQADGPNRRMNRRIDDRRKRWIDNCDITGKHDLYGLQSLAERTRCEAGESLVRRIPVRVSGPLDIPFRLQVLEPDQIDSDKNQVLSERSEIRYGVEFADRVPIAYWLFDTHPGDTTSVPLRRGNYQSVRVPASEIIHYYKPLRPGQTRGITDFAPVILRLRDLDDWTAAKLMRAKISACAVGWVTSPAALPGSSLGPTALNASGKREEMLNPGQFFYGKPGESVTFFDPKTLDDTAFTSDELHAVAAGLGIPYELLTGVLSDVNYTSFRAGSLQFRAAIESDQWQLVVPQLCQREWRWFMEDLARMDGAVDAETPAIFTPPRFQMLDPGKEIPAQLQALQAGIESYPNGLRRDGYDWREKLDEIEEFQKEAERRGIRLTSIPPAQLPNERAGGSKPPPEGGASSPKPREDDDEAEAA